MDGTLQQPSGTAGSAATRAASAVRVGMIVLLLILSGASSGLSFYATGQVMAGYPTFLLYFCNGCYAVGYFVLLLASALVAKVRRDSSDDEAPTTPLLPGDAKHSAPVSSPVWGSWHEQKCFALIGICTGLSLEMQQFSNGKVNGDLRATVCANLVAHARGASVLQPVECSPTRLSCRGCAVPAVPPCDSCLLGAISPQAPDRLELARRSRCLQRLPPRAGPQRWGQRLCGLADRLRPQYRTMATQSQCLSDQPAQRA